MSSVFSGTEQPHVRVLLVAPHRLVRVGIRTVLENATSIEVVAEVAKSSEVSSALRRRVPSVVVIGPRVPWAELVEVIAAVNRTRDFGQTPVLVLTDDDDDVSAMLDAGVRGVLRQGCDDDELVRTVEALAAGGAVFAPDTTFRLLRWYTECACRADHATPPAVADLTPRELDVLRLVGAGMANTEIAEELVLEVSTVKSHVYHVMKKLGLIDRAKVVVFAHEYGLVRRNHRVVARRSVAAPTTG